jgi:transposase
VKVWWVKKRWRCGEAACPRATFTQSTEQVPPFARMTTRLKAQIGEVRAGEVRAGEVRAGEVRAGEVRAVDAVAAQYGVSWPTEMRQLATATTSHATRDAARPRLVSWLGIDEHRFRTVRWYRGHAGAWQRIEPWMTTLTDLASCQVIGVVDGRGSAAVKTWLKTKPRWWRHRVLVVAIDLSAAFRSAVRSWLPKARVSVDHFHLVKLAGDMLTAVRRRVSKDTHDRRGRKTDPAWAHRVLLLRGYDTVSARDRDKLADILDSDDPTHEISAAWGVKEQLRRLLASTTLAADRAERVTFNQYVTWAATPETTRLRKTIDAWWPEIETFIATRITNAKTEAANVTIKNIKRTGRGYRATINYTTRIMLYNAAVATQRGNKVRRRSRKSLFWPLTIGGGVQGGEPPWRLPGMGLSRWPGGNRWKRELVEPPCALTSGPTSTARGATSA